MNLGGKNYIGFVKGGRIVKMRKRLIFGPARSITEGYMFPEDRPDYTDESKYRLVPAKSNIERLLKNTSPKFKDCEILVAVPIENESKI